MRSRAGTGRSLVRGDVVEFTPLTFVGTVRRGGTEPLRAAAADPDGSLPFRDHLDRLTRAVQAVSLLHEAADDEAVGVASTKAAVAAFFVRRHLTPGYDPASDPSYLTGIDTVLAR